MPKKKVAFEAAGEINHVVGDAVTETKRNLRVEKGGTEIARIPYQSLVYVVNKDVELGD